MILVRPSNEKNAIQAAAFALELNREVDERAIEKIRAAYQREDEFSKTFIVEEVITAIKVQMMGAKQEVTSSEIGGLNYIFPDGPKPKWILRIQANTISLTCQVYTCWDEVWTFAKKYFALIFKELDDYSLMKMVVEYLDEFHIADVRTNKWIEELFRPETVYIPRFIYDINDPWHTHNGFITEEKNGDKSRRTINAININFVKNDMSGGALGMQTQHASSFYLAKKIDLDTLEDIENVMVHNHNQNKSILNQILTDEMLNKIGLKI